MNINSSHPNNIKFHRFQVNFIVYDVDDRFHGMYNRFIPVIPRRLVRPQRVT